MDKAQFLKQVLHHPVISVGIDTQMFALVKGPVDTKGTDPLFRSVYCDPMNNTSFPLLYVALDNATICKQTEFAYGILSDAGKHGLVFLKL